MARKINLINQKKKQNSKTLGCRLIVAALPVNDEKNKMKQPKKEMRTQNL